MIEFSCCTLLFDLSCKGIVIHSLRRRSRFRCLKFYPCTRFHGNEIFNVTLAYEYSFCIRGLVFPLLLGEANYADAFLSPTRNRERKADFKEIFWWTLASIGSCDMEYSMGIFLRCMNDFDPNFWISNVGMFWKADKEVAIKILAPFSHLCQQPEVFCGHTISKIKDSRWYVFRSATCFSNQRNTFPFKGTLFRIANVYQQFMLFRII